MPDEPNTEAWRDALSDEQRASNVFANVKDLPDLFTQFQHAQSALGSSLRVPGPESSAGDQQAFYDKVMEKAPGLVRKPVAGDDESSNNFWQGMGRPSDIEGYAVIDNMTPEQTQFMREAALASNLTNDQFRTFASKMAGQAAQDAEQVTFDAKTELDALYHGWGMAKDQKMNAIKLMAGQLGMDATLLAAIESDTPNPKVLALMDTIVAKIGAEGGQLQAQVGETGNAAMTPQEAEGHISDMMNNRDHDYWHAERPGHGAAKRRMVELGRFADPSASTNMGAMRAGFRGSSAVQDTIF